MDKNYKVADNLPMDVLSCCGLIPWLSPSSQRNHCHAKITEEGYEKS